MKGVTPVRDEVIRCTALRRPTQKYGKVLPEWLLCTGANMGKWTIWFGPWCLAGDVEAERFVKNHHEMNEGSEIIEFEIYCTSSLLLDADPQHEWVCGTCKEKNDINPNNTYSKCGRCGALK